MRIKTNPTIKCTNKSQRNDSRGLKQDGDSPPQVAVGLGSPPGEGLVFIRMGLHSPMTWGQVSCTGNAEPSSRWTVLTEGTSRTDGIKGQGWPQLHDAQTAERMGHCGKCSERSSYPVLQKCLYSLRSEMHYSSITSS